VARRKNEVRIDDLDPIGLTSSQEPMPEEVPQSRQPRDDGTNLPDMSKSEWIMPSQSASGCDSRSHKLG